LTPLPIGDLEKSAAESVQAIGGGEFGHTTMIPLI
jgi:hypothetical protein